MSTVEDAKKSAAFLRWLVKRKRVLIVDDIIEQTTKAADLIDELLKKNAKLAARYEALLK